MKEWNNVNLDKKQVWKHCSVRINSCMPVGKFESYPVRKMSSSLARE